MDSIEQRLEKIAREVEVKQEELLQNERFFEEMGRFSRWEENGCLEETFHSLTEPLREAEENSREVEQEHQSLHGDLVEVALSLSAKQKIEYLDNQVLDIEERIRSQREQQLSGVESLLALKMKLRLLKN